MGCVKSIVGGLAALALLPAAARAQEEELAQRCATVTAAASQEARLFCNLLAQAVEIAQPVVGLAATGGNPVPGTASTLGMRLGTLPRVSVALRATGVSTNLPPIHAVGDVNKIDAFVPALNVDAAVGLFRGFSPAPTIGGVLSLDALGSFGYLPLPGGAGFHESPWSWALGLRLGILRESFTVPGVSASAMYRQVGHFQFGDRDLVTEDTFFDSGVGLWSLRAALSKRIGILGLTAGAGYDHYSSNVELAFLDPVATPPNPIRFTIDDFTNDRFALFGNVSWTLLILHLVGEIGWQQGAGTVGAFPLGVDFDAEGANFFGSLAIRLSI